MTTRNQIDVFSDSWMQIGALMSKPRQAASKMEIRPQSKRNNKPRSIATRTMVKTAIKTLMQNPRAGVSFIAIRRYIEENYYKDSKKGFHYVKNYIRKSLERGELIRTKGNGVSGSFRLPLTKRVLKKKPHKKKANENKRKRKGSSVKDIRKKVQKQLKELELNGKLNNGKLGVEKIFEATTTNAVDPTEPMFKEASKLNITSVATHQRSNCSQNEDPISED